MDTADQTKLLQSALRQTPDGYFGPRCSAALQSAIDDNDADMICAAQIALGVEADGWFGPKSRAALAALVAPHQAASALVPAAPAAGNGFVFNATKAMVKSRGHPPESFLAELLAWGKSAPDEIFAVNNSPGDVLAKIEPLLGPWGIPDTADWMLNRKAGMLELLRCLGGFESSWKWTCGVDTTNARSLSNIICQETGIFQVSEDSEVYSAALREYVISVCGTNDTETFLARMKTDHPFALGYAARLLRFSYKWDGPIRRDEIDSSLSRAAMAEWKELLAK